MGPLGDGLAVELLDLDRRQPGAITPYALHFARKSGENATRVDAETGRRLPRSVQERLDAVLDGFDAFLLPTLGATAFVAGEDYVDTALVVNGVPLEHFSDASLTPVFNICSAPPVVAVPSGWAANGVPTGVQVVGAAYDHGTALRVAAAIERVTGAGFNQGRLPPSELAVGRAYRRRLSNSAVRAPLSSAHREAATRGTPAIAAEWA